MTYGAVFPTYNELQVNLNHEQINGKNGQLRANQTENLLNIDDDWSAITCWLENKFSKKENSKQQYLLQAERLLLWAIIEKEKPISSLLIEDYQEYFRFLDNPSPKEKWCMSKGRGAVKRWDKDWRPFTGPLSAASKTTAINCINTMLNYWANFASGSGFLKI